MQLWAYENEFALWCFIALLASAVWMAAARFRQLASTRLRLAHVAAGAIFFPFALLLAITSIQMAHPSWFAPIVWAVRLHRSSRLTGSAAGILFPILAVTGIWLWIHTRPRSGWIAAATCTLLTLSLVPWMRF